MELTRDDLGLSSCPVWVMDEIASILGTVLPNRKSCLSCTLLRRVCLCKRCLGTCVKAKGLCVKPESLT